MKIVDRLKNFAREQLLLLIFLTLGFSGVSVLSVLFFGGEKRHQLLFIEFKAEESAFALLDYYAQGLTPETAEIERITGFAIYDLAGFPTISGGTYPEFVDIADIAEKPAVFNIHWETGRVSIVKPMGMFPAFMVPPSGTARMRGMLRQPRNAAIYLEIAVPELLSPYRLYTAVQIVVPTILLAGFVLVGFVLFKNWEYRKEIDSQRHLVHLGEAARTLSHEIKNPLSAIQIQAAILRKTLPGESLASSRIIDEEVERLRVLTERVGEFLKNPKGNPEPFNAGEFVKDLVGKSPWKIEFHQRGNPVPAVYVDRERFRSVVENLFRNAAESAPEVLPISVLVTAEKSSVQIVVEDNGLGISAEDRNRVFELFFTTKDSGSGIGLAISRRFFEVAGGSISLEPRSVGGTAATIKLPRWTG